MDRSDGRGWEVVGKGNGEGREERGRRRRREGVRAAEQYGKKRIMHYYTLSWR